MLRQSKDTVAVSASIDVAQSCEEGGVDGINYLSDERFFSCLTEFKSELGVAPDVFSSLDLQTSAESGRV